MNFPKSDRQKGEASAGYGRILIIILLGIGLLLVTLGGKKNESETVTDGPTEEERLAELCSSLSGVGRCQVYIAYEERRISYSSNTEKVIVGVAVLCEGGSNDGVKARLTALIDSLYGIGSNRIRIDQMK